MASPGHICLVYLWGDEQHETCVRALTGVNLTSIIEVVGFAEDWAAAMADIIPTGLDIIGWRTKNNAGVRLIDQSLGVSIAGAAEPAEGFKNWLSTTLTITGKEDPLDSDTPGGQALFRYHIGGCLAFEPGDKFYSTAADPLFTTLRDLFGDSDTGWAGFNGNKASIRDLAAVQWNAHDQRSMGS